MRVLIGSSTSDLLKINEDLYKMELFSRKMFGDCEIRKNPQMTSMFFKNYLKNIQTNESVFIYISCHGNNNYLNLENGTMKGTEILNIIKQLNYCKIILWTDACHFDSILKNQNISTKCEIYHITSSNLDTQAIQSSVRSAVFTHEMVRRILLYNYNYTINISIIIM